MDRLLSISGGQPLRTTDWEFIQNMEKALFKSILSGLLPAETSFIICGMQYSIAGTVEVTEGYFFDGEEICYVPSASFTEDENKRLYLLQDISTTENRTFKDSSTNDVWEIRRYQIAYETSQPSGSIVFDSIPMIDKLTTLILSGVNLNSALKSAFTLSYETGFVKATDFNGIKLEKNSIGNYMILAAFNAIKTAGHICTIPVGHRPTGDLVGFFFNSTVTPGVLKIKKNGDVYVSGASTSATNYITFQYLINFEDPILWGLPTYGGGAPPDADPS